MGRKKHCSVDERIFKMMNNGFLYRANIIPCSLGMVQVAIKYQGKEEKRGRPRKTSEKRVRQILRQVKISPLVSISQILMETGEKCVATI